MQLGLPAVSCCKDVPHGQTGSSSTQWATPVPLSDHVRPAGQFAATGELAQPPGVNRQRASGVITPLPPVVMALQALVSKSLDSLTAPPGHVFVVVLNLEPVSPAPQSVTVDWIGMLYGVQLADAVCAKIPPLTQSASSAKIFPIIFNEVPLLKIED